MTRETSRGLLLIGCVVCLIGVAVYYAQADTIGQCQTVLGQLGAALSPDVQQKCSTASTMRTLGGIAGVGGAIAALVGLVGMSSSGQPSSADRR